MLNSPSITTTKAAPIPAKREINISRLRQFDLFGPLSDADLQSIARCCREGFVPAGTVIIRQGQVGKDVYLLEDGLVDVYREQMGHIRMVALLESPTVFGEMAVANRDRLRTASVKAVTDLQLLAISVADMLITIRNCPALRDQLRQLVERRGLDKVEI